MIRTPRMITLTVKEMEKVPMVLIYQIRIELNDGRCFVYHSKEKAKLQGISSMLDQSKIEKEKMHSFEVRDIYGCDEDHVYDTLLSMTNFIS